MTVNPHRRQVLLAAADRERATLRALFGHPLLAGWEPAEADSLEKARFLQQVRPCEVLLLDASLFAGGEGLDWLAGPADLPAVLLADPSPELVLNAFRHGAHQWLPRDLASAHPAVLEAALEQAARFAELRRRVRAADELLQETRGRVDRLASLLWESAPGTGPLHWFNQRYMLERLDEEVARARRHGGALSVVLGEVRPAGGELPRAQADLLAGWTAGRVSQGKRRTDVAGQYGLQGFMLLLPGTPAGGAVHLCRRLRTVLEPPPPGAVSLPPLDPCFGVVSLSRDASTVKGLLSRAEDRLDQAKSSPSGGVASG
jgi:diguanylate cyclase (GGDEF)-like protein